MTDRPRNLLLLDLESQRQRIGRRIEEGINRVVAHGRFIMGPEVQDLEEAFRRRLAGMDAITCGSGTDALQLVLMAWSIGPGDAVFVPDFTYTATAEVVSLLGATPVFCDVDSATYNIDPDSVEAAVRLTLSEGDLVPRAVIPVDLFGLPSEVEAIDAVARRFGLKILVDAAQSFGASLGGLPVGSFGDATATSFFPSKPLGCFGDGGAIFTADRELAVRLRALRAHGTTTDKYYPVFTGMNSRLDSIQAAVLLAKLEILDDEISARRRIAAHYDQQLQEECPTIRRPVLSDSSAWAQYTVRLPQGVPRNLVADSLQDSGVPSAIYYPYPLHDVPSNRQGRVSPDGCSQASLLSKHVLSLPIHPYLDDQDVTIVVNALSCALRGASR